MTLFEMIINIFFSSLSILINMMSYNKLTGERKIKVTLIKILIIIFSGVLVVINTYNNVNIMRVIITFSILLLCSKVIFRDNLIYTIYNSLVCYILMTLYELILAGAVIKLNIINVSLFDKSIIIKNIFSICIVLLVYLTCKSKIFSKKIIKISSELKNKKENIIVLFIFFIVLTSFIIVDFKYTRNITRSMYIGNLIVIICILIMLLYGIYNYFRANREMEKSEILLNFMSKYEKIIDDNRINRHEMLNNLLFLRSIKNKNSEEFNETLNNLISVYDNKKIGIKNIYNLPSGLKGIFYYKLNGLDEKGYNISMNISKQLSNSLKKINHEDYVSLYKIVGILLDNAIESAEKTKDKIISIDIYKENTNTIIEIDNTFSGKISLNKIKEINYSTKGRNRGLGLYIVNNLIKNSKTIQLEQIIKNNIFVSKIIINKKKN